jgi:hypothetical protein
MTPTMLLPGSPFHNGENTMSLADLKTEATKILESTMPAKAPEVLADHLLIKKNRAQLVALAKMFLTMVAPKRELPKPTARRRTGLHRKHSTMPTEEQKLGALRARSQAGDLIFSHKLRGGRKIGDVRYNELPGIIEKSASAATAMLNRGYEDAVDAYFCAGIQDYCVPDDPFDEVKNYMKPSETAKLREQAKLRAAEMLRNKTALLAKELIAHAHNRPFTELAS